MNDSPSACARTADRICASCDETRPTTASVSRFGGGSIGRRGASDDAAAPPIVCRDTPRWHEPAPRAEMSPASVGRRGPAEAAECRGRWAHVLDSAAAREPLLRSGGGGAASSSPPSAASRRRTLGGRRVELVERTIRSTAIVCVHTVRFGS